MVGFIHPATTLQIQLIFWESNLYDAVSKKLIYSVQTKSFNPENSEKLAHEYGHLIINDMLKKEVLK